MLKAFGFILLGVGLTFNACLFDRPVDGTPLAKVGDQVLYLADLQSVLPSGLGYEDSVMMAEDYISKWIRNELLIKKAEENLPSSLKDFTKELKDYRNSMIIYRYKMELMLQRLDTIVGTRELQTYYNENKDNFVLNKSIVKALFIQIPLEVSRPEQVKVFCEQINDANLAELREFCLRYAVVCDIYSDDWVDLEPFLLRLTDWTGSEDRSIYPNAMIEHRDQDFYYLLRIIDHQPANSVAPMEYAESQIKNIIVNRRRIEFLKKVEDDVYLEGVRNNKFKLYEYEESNED